MEHENTTTITYHKTYCIKKPLKVLPVDGCIWLYIPFKLK